MSNPLILGLWSAVLEPGKTFTQNTVPAIQITNISFGAEVTGTERSVVSMKYPEFEEESDDDASEDEDEEDDDEDSPVKLPKLVTRDTVLAVLRPDHTEQVNVNVSLVEDTEVVELAVSGPNKVYLLGHYVRQEDFDQDPYSDEESDFDSNDESIDSDLEDGEGMSGLIGEGDSDEDEEEDKARFEELKEVIKTSNPKKRAAEEEADDVASTLVPKKADKPAAAAAPSSDAAAADTSATLSKNQKKKLAKKLKATDGSAVAPPAPAAAAPAPKAEKKEAAAAAAPAAAAKPTSQTLPGGLVILDAKKGDGPVAKAGKKVGMRYIGKLDNGKVFDSNTKGSPLSFTLGRGEVIKGWDQGIVGMAVGGERKLTIPAALAYGKKGTQGIPGNATLHFDVKLVSLK